MPGRVITVGAQFDDDGPAIVGEAAHIAAASPGGSRYDPAMTDDDRKAQANGIWLCRTCGRKVDVDWKAYPAETLQRWKADAEAAAHANLGKPRALNDARRARQVNELGLFLGHYIQLERRCIAERGSGAVEDLAVATYSVVASYLQREFDTAMAYQG